MADQALVLDVLAGANHASFVAQLDQVPPLRLGARDHDRPQLGWNTWLGGRRDPRPANDCEFHFSAMGGQSWH